MPDIKDITRDDITDGNLYPVSGEAVHTALQLKGNLSGGNTWSGVQLFNNGINLKTTTLNYIYFDDAVAFSRNGTGERMRIDTSGNVGIGTAVPSLWGTFVVAKAAGGTPIIGLVSEGNWDATIKIDNSGNFIISNSAVLEKLRLNSSGHLGINTSAPTTFLDVNADKFRVRTAKTPANASATGNAGDICWDANYIYVCVATNSWKRSAITAGW
jgi:hypothetical protein